MLCQKKRSTTKNHHEHHLFYSWESKGAPSLLRMMVANPSIRPYFLGGLAWWGGPLRFPWFQKVSSPSSLGQVVQPLQPWLIRTQPFGFPKQMEDWGKACRWCTDPMDGAYVAGPWMGGWKLKKNIIKFQIFFEESEACDTFSGFLYLLFSLGFLQKPLNQTLKLVLLVSKPCACVLAPMFVRHATSLLPYETQYFHASAAPSDKPYGVAT